MLLAGFRLLGALGGNNSKMKSRSTLWSFEGKESVDLVLRYASSRMASEERL